MQEIMESIAASVEDLSSGQFNFIHDMAIAGAAVFIVFIISIITSMVRRKRQERKYIENFQREFTGNIRTTLQALQMCYRKNSDMWVGISKALFYLDHSIRRDYAGALRCIERVMESKKVTDMHKEYISKIPVTHLLPQGIR